MLYVVYALIYTTYNTQHTTTMSREYTTGDVDLKIKVESEKEVTIDELVQEANEIWKYARSKKLTLGDHEASGKLMSDVQRKHRQFCQAYPIVNRYICEMQQYSPKAFRLWLMKIKDHPWRSEDEYLEAQTDYIVMLFKVLNPRANRAHVSQLRANISAILRVEHEKFKYYTQEFDKEVTAEESMLGARSMGELHDFVVAAGEEGMAPAGTVRMKADVGSAVGDWLDVDKAAAELPPSVLPDVTSDDLLG